MSKVMSDIAARDFPTQLAVTCDFCGESCDVNLFCKQCAGSMCYACKSSHLKITAFKSHIIVQRTNEVMRLYGPSKIAEHCPIHPEKEISTYCNECQVPCCVTCQVKNHKCHDISTIEDAFLSAEKRLNDNVKKLEKEVIPKLDSIVEKAKKDRSDKINRVREEAYNFKKEMKQVVEESFDQLLEKLDRNDTDFDNFIARIDSQKGKVRMFIQEIDGIIQKGDLDMIKYIPPTPSTLVPEFTIPKFAIPIFTPGRDTMITIKKSVGEIEWVDPSKINIFTPGRDTMITIKKSVGEIEWVDPSVINIMEVMSFRSEIDATSIVTTGYDTAWVMDYERDAMQLYDCEGAVVRSVTVKGCKGIHDMVIRRSGEMIFTCRDRKVRSVSVNGKLSALIDTSPFEPYGICLTDREDIVVCLSGQAKGNHVAKYSFETRKKLHEIRGSDAEGNQHITDPYRVVLNNKDLCVINLNPRNVVCVDERGVMKWLYGGKGYNLFSFGLTVDKYNNLLITNVNKNCVHYVDKDGRLIKIIRTREHTVLSQVLGICIDNKKGHIWVGHGKFPSNRISIFKYIS